jgi:endonuclease/exonuclease/phosphatase (EEP) superfamily protein YafD
MPALSWKSCFGRLRSMRPLHRIVAAIALLYPLSLLAAAAALRFVGERWWVTGLALYLPRLPFAAPLPFIAIAVGAWPQLRRLFWTQIVALFLLVFVLMGFVLPWPTRPAKEAPVLRLLSYNINAATGGVKNIVAEIDRYSPDVVLLQELGFASESVGSLLQERYPIIHVSGQFLLATRYPVSSIIEPEEIDYGGRQRSPRFVRQILQTPLGDIALYNVHPLSPREIFYSLRGRGLRRELLSRRLFSSANAAVFQSNSGLRNLQVERFTEAAARETDPVVIAGDTNLASLSFVLHHYLSGYQDGFAKAGWGFGYTFPTDRGVWMRLDRVFASEQLRFVRFEVGTSIASDHHCVVAELQRRNP